MTAFPPVSTGASIEDFDVPAPGESSTALLTLEGLPFDAALPLVHHYPAMKLGIRASIEFCAKAAGVAARDILAAKPDLANWVIASPPRFVLPGAANLIARLVHRNLCDRDGAGPAQSIDCAELLLAPPGFAVQEAEPTRLYSQAGFDERVRERQRIHERLIAPDPHRFSGRAVLFINDINVTGAQQHFMRKALLAAGAASIHWLYLVKVPPAAGKAHPGIEYELNYSRFAAFDAFAAVVASEGIEFTARCINRLFDCGEGELSALFRTLAPARKALLLRLAAEEAKCQGRSTEYWSKLARVGAG